MDGEWHRRHAFVTGAVPEPATVGLMAAAAVVVARIGGFVKPMGSNRFPYLIASETRSIPELVFFVAGIFPKVGSREPRRAFYFPNFGNYLLIALWIISTYAFALPA